VKVKRLLAYYSYSIFGKKATVKMARTSVALPAADSNKAAVGEQIMSAAHHPHPHEDLARLVALFKAGVVPPKTNGERGCIVSDSDSNNNQDDVIISTSSCCERMNRADFVATFANNGPVAEEYCGRLFDYMIVMATATTSTSTLRRRDAHRGEDAFVSVAVAALPLSQDDDEATTLDVLSFSQEMLRCLEMDDHEDRFHHLMEIYDTDGDGYIRTDDLLPFFKAAFEELKLKMDEEDVKTALSAMLRNTTTGTATRPTGTGTGPNEDDPESNYNEPQQDNNQGFSFHQVRSLIGNSLDNVFHGSLLGNIGGSLHLAPHPTILSNTNNANAISKNDNSPSGGEALPPKRCQGINIRESERLISFIMPPIKKSYSWFQQQWRFNRPRMVWLVLYIVTNILVFVAKFLVWRYSAKYAPARTLSNNAICFAKAFAAVATFNTGLIFFPICRRFVACLRDQTAKHRHGDTLYRWIPFNDNIKFHIIAGHVTMVSSIGHVVAHLILFRIYSQASDDKWNAWPMKDHMNGPRPSYVDMLRTLPGWTGHVMLLIMLIAYPVASLLRRRYFNTFWYTHQLYILWAIMFLIHGTKEIFQPAQAIWVALPGLTILMGERLMQTVLCRDAYCRVKVVHAETFDNTTVLYTTKPKPSSSSSQHHQLQLFNFVAAGSYASINIPSIAQFEWHPFTISSAPEDKYLRFHIRRAGDWTSALWHKVNEMTTMDTNNNKNKTSHSAMATSDRITEHMNGQRSSMMSHPVLQYHGGREVEEMQDSLWDSDGGDAVIDGIVRDEIQKLLPAVYIQGPYGAPAQDFMRYDHIILVGAGIGVTPFASIIRHILIKWRWEQFFQADRRAFAATHSVQFHWVTREHESLSWFAKELTELLALDRAGEEALEVHQYLTGVKSHHSSSHQLLVSNLQKALHCPETEHTDIVSGIRGSKHLTHFGRPDFEKHFKAFASSNSTKSTPTSTATSRVISSGKKVGVFYCGPPPLKQQLQAACRSASSTKPPSEGGVTFDFYNENF
jgi:predicted ferric reductase